MDKNEKKLRKVLAKMGKSEEEIEDFIKDLNEEEVEDEEIKENPAEPNKEEQAEPTENDDKGEGEQEEPKPLPDEVNLGEGEKVDEKEEIAQPEPEAEKAEDAGEKPDEEPAGDEAENAVFDYQGKYEELLKVNEGLSARLNSLEEALQKSGVLMGNVAENPIGVANNNPETSAKVGDDIEEYLKRLNK